MGVIYASFKPFTHPFFFVGSICIKQLLSDSQAFISHICNTFFNNRLIFKAFNRTSVGYAITCSFIKCIIIVYQSGVSYLYFSANVMLVLFICKALCHVTEYVKHIAPDSIIFYTKAFRWRHMTIKVFHTTGKWVICSISYSGQPQGYPQKTRYWPCMGEIQWWSMDSPQKGQ